MEQWFAIQVRFNFKISLLFGLWMSICWLTEQMLEFCQHLLKLTQLFICQTLIAIPMKVHFDEGNSFSQAEWHVYQFRLQYDDYTNELYQQKEKFVSQNGLHRHIFLHNPPKWSEWQICNHPPCIKVFNDVIVWSWHLKNSFSHLS